MADESKPKKPRIRKAPQTMREKAEAAQNKAEKPKKRLTSKAVHHAKRPVKAFGSKLPKVKLPKLPQNRITKVLGAILRPFWRLMRWFPVYFVSAWREVRLVTWPSRKETWRLTLAVFIFAIVFGSLAWTVDKGLDKIFKEVILK